MKFLMAVRSDEAEPVAIEVQNGTVTLTLDDGEVLVFDRQEFEEAVNATKG